MKMMPPDVISHDNQLQHLSEPSIFILDVFRTADPAGQIFIPHRHGGPLPPQSTCNRLERLLLRLAHKGRLPACGLDHHRLRSWLRMPIWGCLDLSAPTRPTFLATTSMKGNTLGKLSVLDRAYFKGFQVVGHFEGEKIEVLSAPRGWTL